MPLISISSIPQIYRHVNRWREILAVFSKYGLAHWVSWMGPESVKDLIRDPNGESLARLSQEARIRLALTELGPTFIKLGQILSTRPDLVGVRLSDELQRLQADIVPVPGEQVRQQIENELGQSVDDLFAEFDDQALASASIGQVHQARLKNGERVAVKVQHPGVEAKIRVDLEIVSGMALLAERIPELKNYRPRATVAEFQRTILRELDFGREERHIQEFAHHFAGNGSVRIPKTYPELTAGRVLTMEFLDGIKLCDKERIAASGIDLEEVARRGADLYMEMIFVHGFYHADPHPGNLVLLPGNVIGLLDFGMVGRIDESLREDIEEMLLAINQRDAAQLTSVVMRVGQVPAQLDRTALSVDIADYVSHYAGQRLNEFDLSGALNEMMEIVRRYHIMLPARIAMLIKVLVMLEGTSQLLNPQFNLAEVMRTYQSRVIWQRLSPARQIRKMRRVATEFQHLIEVFPRGMMDILQQVQSGKFDVHLDHRGLEPSVNRLVYGMLSSALFLGSSLLLSRNVPPLLNNVSILGAAGCLLSMALSWRLMRAIAKSGHLDRRR